MMYGDSRDALRASGVREVSRHVAQRKSAAEKLKNRFLSVARSPSPSMVDVNSNAGGQSPSPSSTSPSPFSTKKGSKALLRPPSPSPKHFVASMRNMDSYYKNQNNNTSTQSHAPAPRRPQLLDYVEKQHVFKNDWLQLGRQEDFVNSEIQALDAKLQRKTQANAYGFRNTHADEFEALSPSERNWLREGAEEFSEEIVDRKSAVDTNFAMEQHRKTMATHFTLSQDYAREQPTLAFHSVLGLKSRGAAKMEDLDDQDDWLHRNRQRLELQL